MTYQLAKELKDAGYPQRTKSNRYVCPHTFPREDRVNFLDCSCDKEGKIAALPTLEELIEACEDRLIAIQKSYNEEEITKGKWCAVEMWEAYYPPEVKEGSYGDSPSEAVARLWLELRKKE